MQGGQYLPGITGSFRSSVAEMPAMPLTCSGSSEWRRLQFAGRVWGWIASAGRGCSFEFLKAHGKVWQERRQHALLQMALELDSGSDFR
jgi:hypothetical protein